MDQASYMKKREDRKDFPQIRRSDLLYLKTLGYYVLVGTESHS